MKNLYLDTRILDERAREKFGLSEEILMENAAAGIANFICKKFKKGMKVLGVCGSGNNGADVLCALRMLEGEFECEFILASQNFKPLVSKQLERAKSAGVRECKDVESSLNGANCVIDGLFGSGLNRNLDKKHIELISKINKSSAYTIACDIPSGLNSEGKVLGACVKADITITMGARKLGLYSDAAKDFVGKIKVTDLGISAQNYECESDYYLLEKCDLVLPNRKNQCVNKGDFGHAFIISGEHIGASKLCAKAAFAFGAGLVSVIGEQSLNLPTHIMQASKISDKMNAGAVGMGLGKKGIEELDAQIFKGKRLVLDADIFYSPKVLDLLDGNCVLTPHPKEFCSLLKICKIADIDVQTLQENRFTYAKSWSEKFKAVLVLKGANTIIAKDGKIYIMPYGKNILAKGGSGDVLSGLVLALLAQGYEPLDAAISATLAHALSLRNFGKNSYALEPTDIIKGVKCLRKK
ncbi:bifunctional ADP-dependent NAD(P)H-hydrate dehydratase/NAD(P)H-hydrate epimerase [Campylobacter concisus]|uniref:Bifunctional NAD(P)H-hydrate repair enzyme n=1 Tax=Campylobacter concisus TaxID=199 RepID=A0A0M3V1X2_9BACT|nr:bifunctional ADP-dependent NAD(P)H-hydrate dehydratase/NAD(P)H-hydrate epimerase [Campylobacter concisus]ALF46908.1 carbohydrate kinase, YjeF-related protein [Campylobacter concisus]